MREFPALADAFFTRYVVERGREINVDGWTAWLDPLETPCALICDEEGPQK
jgi:hypothetical protein